MFHTFMQQLREYGIPVAVLFVVFGAGVAVGSGLRGNVADQNTADQADSFCWFGGSACEHYPNHGGCLAGSTPVEPQDCLTQQPAVPSPAVSDQPAAAAAPSPASTPAPSVDGMNGGYGTTGGDGGTTGGADVTSEGGSVSAQASDSVMSMQSASEESASEESTSPASASETSVSDQSASQLFSASESAAESVMSQAASAVASVTATSSAGPTSVWDWFLHFFQH